MERSARWYFKSNLALSGLLKRKTKPARNAVSGQEPKLTTISRNGVLFENVYGGSSV